MNIAELVEKAWEDFCRRVEGNHPRGILKSDFEEVALTLLRKAAEGSITPRRVDITDPFLRAAVEGMKAMAKPQGSPDAFLPRTYEVDPSAALNGYDRLTGRDVLMITPNSREWVIETWDYDRCEDVYYRPGVDRKPVVSKKDEARRYIRANIKGDGTLLLEDVINCGHDYR